MRITTLTRAGLAAAGLATLGLSAAAVTPAGAAVTPLASAKKYVADMNGSSVVPGPGDPDATASVTLQIRPGAAKVCMTAVTFANISPATGMKLYSGAAGAAGAELADLTILLTGKPCTVVSLSSTQLTDIRKNPANYYLQWTTGDFPNGAVRGQLHLGA